MGYLGDWTEAEDAFLTAHEANPECDETDDCQAPADGHLLTCRRWRKER